MKMINFLMLFVSVCAAFSASCAAFMLAIAVPSTAPVIWILLGIASIASIVWWLFDGDLSTGVQGLAIFVGIILGAIAKWRGMVG